jgi:Ca2+-binding EF-hand superfamily protein
VPPKKRSTVLVEANVIAYKEIFADLDEEELGGITFEYFLKSLDIDRPRKEKKDTIRRVYRKYDKKNKGYILLEDLRQVVLKELQEDIDDEVLKEVFVIFNHLLDLHSH